MIIVSNSDIITAFLNLIIQSENEYQFALELQRTEEKKTQDVLHMLDLDNLNYKERAKLATQLKNIRQKRRRYKGEVEELECIVQFKKENKNLVNMLTQLLGKQRKVEKSHIDRHYTPKVLKRCDSNILNMQTFGHIHFLVQIYL